jgi:hypothetical protein
MRLILLAALVPALVGCDWDVEEKHYATRAEVPAHDFWMPRWVPASAIDILDVHNIDTSAQTVTFSLPPDEIQPLVADLRPILPRHESATRTLAREREWTYAAADQKLEGYYVCNGPGEHGVLIVARSAARVLFERSVTWALPPCSEDV